MILLRPTGLIQVSREHDNFPTLSHESHKQDAGQFRVAGVRTPPAGAVPTDLGKTALISSKRVRLVIRHVNCLITRAPRLSVGATWKAVIRDATPAPKRRFSSTAFPFSLALE